MTKLSLTRPLNFNAKDVENERRSRSLVAPSPDDARFTQKQFLLAPVCFANNDLKYGCTKMCAHTYGTRTQHGIVYSVAKDAASAEALAAKPDTFADQQKCLQQHDRGS